MNRLKNPLLALTLAGLLAAPPTFAADATTTRPAANVINLKLSGPVSVADYVDYVRQTTGLNILLIADRGIDPAKVMMPAMDLAAVSPTQALCLLGEVPTAEIEIRLADDPNASPLLKPDPAVGSKSINVVKVMPIGSHNPNFGAATPGAPNAGTAVGLTVFPLEKMLFGESPKERVPDDKERERIMAERSEQLLALAEQTFTMVPPSGDRPELRYHAGAHLLLVKAVPADSDRIARLIDAMAVPAESDAQKQFEEKLAEAQRKYVSELAVARLDRESMARDVAAAVNASESTRADSERSKAQLEQTRDELARLQRQYAARAERPTTKPGE